MTLSRIAGSALALGSMALAPQALAQVESKDSISGHAECSVATGYILQKVNLVVTDKDQLSCAGSAAFDTEDFGFWKLKGWNTTDIDGGFSAETDLGADWKPSKESPLTLGASKFILAGDNNDIMSYTANYNLGSAGSFDLQILDPARGETGFVAGYNAPKFKHDLPFDTTFGHGLTISYARRANSGEELASLRYNASLSRPVAEKVDFVVRGQLAKPIYKTGAVDSDAISQVNAGLKLRY